MKDAIDSPSYFIGKGGGKLLSFGSGQPDIPPPKQVYKVDIKKVPFKYGLIQGDIDLRTALTKEFPRSNPGQFVITNGASEALDLIFRHIGENGGKKILIPRPYYYSYPGIVKLAGMEPVFTDLIHGKLDVDDVQEKMHECDAILINSPGNPTGTIQDVKTLKEIEKICTDLGKVIISDEVYKDLHYERGNYLIKGENVITVNSFSKTYSMCGHRVGYLHSYNPDMVQGTTNIKNWSSMNTSLISQAMATEALKSYKQRSKEIKKVFKERRDVIYNGMKDLGLDLWKPEGAFYVFPKFENASRTMHELYLKHHMITYDGAWFGDPNRVRFSYALNVDKIEEGLKRLKKYMNERN